MLLANEIEMAKGAEATLRPTHEALMQRKAEQDAKRKAERGDKVGVQTVEPGEIKYQVRKKRGTLMERSAILCAGGQWAMVPTEAVIHVPSAYQARVNGERKGKLVAWSEFFAKNRGWLHHIEFLHALVPDFRMLVCVRELGQVYGSVEAQHQKTILSSVGSNAALNRKLMPPWLCEMHLWIVFMLLICLRST